MLGDYAERQAANRQLQLYGLLAAIAIFFLLQASFNSFRLAALSFADTAVRVDRRGDRDTG